MNCNNTKKLHILKHDFKSLFVILETSEQRTRNLFHFKGGDAGHGVHGPEEAVQDRERVGGEEAAVPENPGRAREQKS